jgi:predicted phosphate transport protein (TIGR00153 family)
MFRWYRRLMPREDKFFALFARHADCIVKGAEELRLMLNGGSDVRTHYPAVLAAEHQADAITRDVMQAVRRTFVTPFDRGSIQTLIDRMDDSIDQMKKAAKTIMLFDMTAFDDNFRAMGQAIVDCAHLLREALPLLASMSPNSAAISQICEKIRRIESQADDLHEEGIVTLFKSCKGDEALRFIAVREVLDQLERIVDRFDDAASEIEGIVIEHV